MQTSSQLLSEAVESMSQFPGVGQKTALRMVLHLLRKDPQKTELLSQRLLNLIRHIHYCTQCHALSDKDLCQICQDTQREQNVICVVENVHDVLAVENTGLYKGLYHVLDGLINPLQGIGPKQLNMQSLFKRLEKGQVKEVVLALNANIEGDTTAHYIAKKSRAFDVTVSTIARGIPVGGELEYMDELTLGRSIEERILYPFSDVKTP